MRYGSVTSRRLLAVMAVMLACAMASVPVLLVAQQPNGVIGGRAGNQYASRYADYTVQLRDAATGKPVTTTTLDQYGRFSFPGLELNQRYMVEFYQTKPLSLVCTEGPFRLIPDKLTEKTDVTIECGKVPAILWLMLAGAGTASAVATTTASASR